MSQTSKASPRGARADRSTIAGYYGVGILILATIFAMLNRQILVLLAQSIAESLNVSDSKIGLLLGTGLTLFVGIAAAPVGWLADRFGRQRTLCICILIWSVGTATCGLAPSYGLLFLATATVGIGEAGLTPIAYGLIPEIVPEQRRVFANSVYQLAVYLGSALGLLLGGALLGHVDGFRPFLPEAVVTMPAWRLAFFAVAIPAPIVALLVLSIRTRFATGCGERSAAGGASTVRMRPFLSAHRATLTLVFSGFGLGLFGYSAVATWTPTLIVRAFQIPIADVGKSIGSIYLVATLVGAIVGIFGGRQLRKRFGAGGATRAFAVGMAVAAAACGVQLWAQTANQIYSLFGIQTAAIIACGTLTPTVIQDMAPPALRSRIAGIAATVGVSMSSLSPVAVGLMSEALPVGARTLLTSVALIGMLGFACGAALMSWAGAAFVRTVAVVNAEILAASK